MKNTKKSKIVFIKTVMLSTITFFLMNLLINGQVDTVGSENRTANKINSYNNASYIDGSFQYQFENALNDQFPFSENIKIVFNTAMSKISGLFRKNILRQDCEVTRYRVRGDVYNLYCYDYLVSEQMNDEYIANEAINFANFFNNYDTNTTQFYAYLINDSRTFSDITRKQNDEFYNNLSSALVEKNFITGQLEVKSIDDLMTYFYKTDHHWNEEGFYHGYKDIISMLEKDSQVKMDYKINTNMNFCGSFCREIGFYDYKEDFYIPSFNYGDLDIYINGKKDEYGKEEMFLGEYKLQPKANYYGGVYGGDYGEIVIDNLKDDAGEHLLIISESFSNPINKLIANHFDKTYIVDLRHYETDLEKVFYLNDYIQENGITKVLYLGNIDFYMGMYKYFK